MPMTPYLKNALVGHVFLETEYPLPTVYAALFTVTPTDSDPGTEVAGGSYSRALYDAIQGSGDGKVQNSASIVFSNLPACTVVGAGLFDDSGNLLVYGDLPVPVTYAAGDGASAAPGTLTFTLA